MSQFDQIVKNIAVESKKSNYNPEIGTNWDYLPMEMRNECVKRMDFKTRIRLGATAKTEKSLVEAKKYRIHQVRLDMNEDCNKWMVNSIPQLVTTRSRKSDAFLSAIFKEGEIKNFVIKGDEYGGCCFSFKDFDRLHLKKFAPFRFKRISLFRNRNIYFFLENSVNLEKVDIGGDPCGCSLLLLLKLPSLMTVKEFRFSQFSQPPRLLEFLIGLIRKWIDNNVEIGKSVQFEVEAHGRLAVVAFFASKFAERVLRRSKNHIRIRMNSQATQILFRYIGTGRVKGTYLTEMDYCSCKVVPIYLPKSEYANGDEWIQAVYEKGLKEDGKLENAMEFDAEDQAVWGEECL